MKVTLTADLPDDLTPKEVEQWKSDMAVIAGYYVVEAYKNRAQSIRAKVADTVEFTDKG